MKPSEKKALKDLARHFERTKRLNPNLEYARVKNPTLGDLVEQERDNCATELFALIESFEVEGSKKEDDCREHRHIHQPTKGDRDRCNFCGRDRRDWDIHVERDVTDGG